MRSSYRLFRIFGIPVEMHITFVLFILLLLFLGLLGVVGIQFLLYVILLFTVVLSHELCHSVVAKGFGIKVPKITLLPIGGLANVELPENPVQELAISISGPLFNFLVAGLGLALLSVFNVGLMSYSGVLDGFIGGEGGFSALALVLNLLIYINLVLGLFNVLPAFPMDGGRILRGVLALWMDYMKATKIAIMVGQFFFGFMVLVGILSVNLWLVIAGLFMSMSGSSELKYITVRRVFSGVTLRDIASRDVRLVEEHVRVGDFLRLVVRNGVRYYFVVDYAGNLKGIVDLNELSRRGADLMADVGGFARRGIAVAEADSRMEEALRGVMSHDIVVVVDSGRLAGYVTREIVEDSLGYYGAAKRLM